MALIILLLLLGLALIILEIVFIPGTTIVGFIGGICMLGGIIKCYLEYGAMYGHISLASSVVLLSVAFYFMMKYEVWSRVALKETISSRFNDQKLSGLAVGDTGVTKSVLRPVGKAIFHDLEYEVRTYGEYLSEGIPVKIKEIKQLKIFVEPLES